MNQCEIIAMMPDVDGFFQEFAIVFPGSIGEVSEKIVDVIQEDHCMAFQGEDTTYFLRLAEASSIVVNSLADQKEQVDQSQIKTIGPVFYTESSSSYPYPTDTNPENQD